MTVIRYLHVVAATVWVGGLIVLATLVPAIRQVTEERSVIRAVAQRFGVVSWIALGTLVLTGGVLATQYWSRTLVIKIGLVLLVAILAAGHSVMASEQSPRTRGMIQGLILVVSLVILWVAVVVL